MTGGRIPTRREHVKQLYGIANRPLGWSQTDYTVEGALDLYDRE